MRARPAPRGSRDSACCPCRVCRRAAGSTPDSIAITRAATAWVRPGPPAADPAGVPGPGEEEGDLPAVLRPLAPVPRVPRQHLRSLEPDGSRGRLPRRRDPPRGADASLAPGSGGIDRRQVTVVEEAPHPTDCRP